MWKGVVPPGEAVAFMIGQDLAAEPNSPQSGARPGKGRERNSYRIAKVWEHYQEKARQVCAL